VNSTRAVIIQSPQRHHFLNSLADVEKARTWLGSDDLKAATQKSGVIGSPSIRCGLSSRADGKPQSPPPDSDWVEKKIRRHMAPGGIEIIM
jgi:hypothetical protein